MKFAQRLVAKDRLQLSAVAAWLNRDRRHGPTFMLPDGSVFPQQEPDEFVEPARRWVDDLIVLDWNLLRWREKHPKDWDEFDRGLSQYRPLPTLVSKKQLVLYYEPINALILPPLWWVFAFLLLNPERERLGRCDRCQWYYVSQGRYLRKRFCSRRCAHNAAARRYVGRQQAEYRQKRLGLARRLLRRWRPVSGDWKSWLVASTSTGDVSLTRNFLTRCELRRELDPPKKGKHDD